MQVGKMPVLWPCLWWIICSIAVLFGASSSTNARSNPAASCDRAAVQVSDETGVPIDILRTITRAETGRKEDGELHPWPWTVNMEGKGVWFDSEAQAQAYVFRRFREGARSFDVGCFQINYKWHGHAFASIEEMFDPIINARYAARYLSELFTAHGDWNKAVGAYHSKTQKHAQRYLHRYTDIREALPKLQTAQGPQTKGFAMLPGKSVQHVAGSLVPFTHNRRGRLIDTGHGG